MAQSGRYAMRVDTEDLAAGQRHLDRLLPHEDMLLQPYVDAIHSAGEISVVYVDGAVTHAVRKRSAGSDFRVHSDYGGSVTIEDPSPPLERVALAAVAALPEPVKYARVDLVEDVAMGPLVLEFEVVEPELFFGASAAATERFADAVVAFVR